MERKKTRGFLAITTETVMAAVVILAVTTFAIINVRSFIYTAREARASQETGAVGSLVSQYHLEVEEYPSTLTELTKVHGQYGPWLKEVPKDPFRTNQELRYAHDKNGFVVFSVGKNGAANSSASAGIKGDDIGFYGR